MSFGKTLKRIRLKHKDSLRGLAKKIDLHFTFIDKVEKGTAPISKNFIENVIAVYPDEREILKKEYLKETLPNVFQKEDAIKIVSNSEILNLPVYGKASAGRGYMNMDSPDYYMPILRGNFSKRSFFVEVTYNDEGYIKRLEMNNKLKLITLKSDNPDYEDIDIPEEMQEYFTVNGRVVEVISKKKLL